MLTCELKIVITTTLCKSAKREKVREQGESGSKFSNFLSFSPTLALFIMHDSPSVFFFTFVTAISLGDFCEISTGLPLAPNEPLTALAGSLSRDCSSSKETSWEGSIPLICRKRPKRSMNTRIRACKYLPQNRSPVLYACCMTPAERRSLVETQPTAKSSLQ